LAHQELLRNDNNELPDRSLLSFGGSSFQLEDDLEWDFSCESGIKTFLEDKPSTKITKRFMKGSVFASRLNNRFHGMVKASLTMRYQYCYYRYKYEFDAKQQEVYEFMKQNKQYTVRCLACNVNLCSTC
jgi:hypothetical protein